MDTSPAGNPELEASEAPDIGGPERKCVLTGVHSTPDMLLRLALGPDGEVGADFAAKLPGRGAWVSLDRAALEKALVRGKLKGALAHAFKAAPSTLQIAPDFADQISHGLRLRALNRLGLEKKSGHLVMGSDQVEKAGLMGKSRLVLHAGDAAVDGMRKLRRQDSPDVAAVQLPCSRVELGLALGRDAVVHCALIDSRAAARCLIDIRRWLAYGAGPHVPPGALAADAILPVEKLA